MSYDNKWAYENCPYIFQKYINEKKDDSIIIVDEIKKAFKDISIQYDFDEYEQLLEGEINRYAKDQTVSKAEFEEILIQWILMFKQKVTSELLSNCLDILYDRYDKKQKEIEDLMRSLNQNNEAEVDKDNFFQFITQLMPIIEVRIVNLDTKKPRSDENVWDDKDEANFLDSLNSIIESNELTTIDVDTSKEVLVEYFKGEEPKYSFVILLNFDNLEEIDPFADLGEEDPFNSQVKQKKNAEKLAEEAIEQEISQAEIEGNTDKVILLKKIKQFYVLKHTADSEREKEGIDLMINRIRKQIAELDANQENNQINYQASVDNNDFKVENVDYEEENQPDLNNDINNSDYEQYPESKQISRKPKGIRDNSPFGMNSNNSKSPNRITRTSINEVEKRLDSEPSETLEDKQNRGIKEIFDFYTRQHLMVGKKATFEQIEYELSNINMGEFMKFCKDFNVPLSKIKWAEVFKKTARNSKDKVIIIK